MSAQAEGKYRAAKERLASAPNDLAALREFAEASRGFDKRDEAVAAMKAAYGRRPTPELYAELRSICTFPEFQAIAKPPESGAAPPKQAGTGVELLPRKKFPLLLDQVIFYPVQNGMAVFILIVCTFLITAGHLMLAWAGFMGYAAAVILWGVAYAYFWSVLHSSGMGEKETRGWPDFSDPGSLGTAVGQYFMVNVVCFGPAVLMLYYPLFFDSIPGLLNLVGAIVLFFAGVVYYPMALMLAGFTHSVGEMLNLPAAIRSIFKIPMDYLICLAFFVGSYILVVIILVILGATSASATTPLPLKILLTLFGQFINTYLFIVQMRTAGLLYYAREKDLGWFQ